MKKVDKTESVKKVERFLKEFNSSMQVIVLKETANTAVLAAKALNCEVGAIIKSLLIKSDYSFLLCLIAGDKRCSFSKLKIILNSNSLSMANADEVKFQTGFSIGGVSPIAHKNKLPIYIDKSLSRFKEIFGAAGHPNYVFNIRYDELVKMTKGLVEEISE